MSSVVIEMTAHCLSTPKGAVLGYSKPLLLVEALQRRRGLLWPSATLSSWLALPTWAAQASLRLLADGVAVRNLDEGAPRLFVMLALVLYV